MLQRQSPRARVVLLLVMGLRLLLLPAAQAQVPTPDTTLGVALRNLASRAGVAFVGQVTQIERTGDVVLVHFRVDQNLLGDAPNPYILREWAGLWPHGEQRYYPGQRAMVFLHTPASSGFSSPVDGAEGMVPVIPQGAENTPLLDVRRLDTRLLRNVGDPLPDSTTSAILLTDAATVVQRWHDPTWTEPVRRPLPVEAIPTIVSTDPTTGAPISRHRLVPSIPKPQQPQPQPFSVLAPRVPVTNAPR